MTSIGNGNLFEMAKEIITYAKDDKKKMFQDVSKPFQDQV